MKDFRLWRRKAARWRPARRKRMLSARVWTGRLVPAAWLAAPLLAALLLPLAVVHQRQHDPAATPAVPVAPDAPQRTAAPAAREPAVAEAPQPKVSVYLSHTRQIETLPLEDYVTGVIAAEMPADFELEALKAQAVAARTFIVRRLRAGDRSGVPAAAADVTDTVSHQAYVSSAVLQRDWAKAGRSADLAKLRRAALETSGIVMTYRGEPITASFFASSGGYTENSEDYWKAAVPYLRSVASPWDQEVTPGLKVTATFSVSELREKLGIEGDSGSGAQKVFSPSGVTAEKVMPLSAEHTSIGEPRIEVLSVTAGHRVKEISIDGKVFTGREVREKLGLRSSQFTWTMGSGRIAITTYGSGHGVGMSQWGANGMAKTGSTATQILKHYYSGISFTQVSTLLKK
ncbi:stage II sporulation protein D [Paenibacillus sophorae]|uniref:Stage II sporulation protein D n=1 Tax=Paenibacillus sophorae TaxID=1333845 RepID=A0A1H8IAL3_9BACL|nr:stage II sporulation protein D [Paenibacillus sophorae]QWU15898.1 stage II sporulation protein D [Paenibacillus sophorae]SEN65282.1 stage II sporulation protein D [Paenibacillus sophorae]